MKRFAVLFAGTLLLAAAPPTDEAQIRALRSENNAAMLARDQARLSRAYAPGYAFIRGFSGAIGQGPDASARSLAVTDWRDPAFVTYSRTPSRIALASDGKRAAEWGNWVGEWRAPAPVTRRTGEYLAVWVPTREGWRLRSETFVALGCVGVGCTARATR
jgi:hypothetical protein